MGGVAKQKFETVCDEIAVISPYIRFVAVIDGEGHLLAYKRRPNMVPLLNQQNTTLQFSHIAVKTGMEMSFDKSLGEVEFVWEERRRVQTISFGIKNAKVWLSIDKKVIRSEMLRIIDSCLPIVRRFSE